MATQTQVNAFISKLSQLAIAEAKKRTKWVLPSVCIAQAALETGWGTSTLMTKANAYFGIKAGSGWTGKVYNAKTQECYDGRTYVTITDCFRAYGSVAASVADYYDLICNNARYAGAVNQKDAKTAITAIKNGGYATSPTYIENVMAIVTKYNLTKYDTEIIAPKPSAQAQPKIVAGMKCVLIDCPIYSTSTGSAIGKRSGTYFTWDSVVKNGRIRMTNLASRVGVASQVSFWIDVVNLK